MRRSGEMKGADTQPGLLFDLVDERRSPVSSALLVLYKLFTFFDDPGWEGFLRSLPLELMSDDIWWRLRRTILVSYGQLWYRLVWRYRGWPWKVASMCDPRIELHKRRESITRFLKMSPCCFDPGLGRKQLKRFQDAEALAMLQLKVQRFLIAFFNSIMLSNLCLECGFC